MNAHNHLTKGPAAETPEATLRRFISDLKTESVAAAQVGVESQTAMRLAEGRLTAAEILRLRDASARFDAWQADLGSPGPAEVRSALAVKYQALDAVLDSTPTPPGDLEATIKMATRLDALPKSWTVRQLLETEFPPPAWIVEGLLTSGLTIFAGAPKLGKSWLALGLGVAVGAGGAVLGAYQVDRRQCLYLALEDHPRRLQDRLRKIGAPVASGLTVFNSWRSGVDGCGDLDCYLSANPNTRLVLIDTLAKFRDRPLPGESLYDADYRTTGMIKEIADRHEAAVVVIHHVRKMRSEDVMDSVTGSNGINGAADGTWILTRSRGEADAQLFATGRDFDEKTLALRFDKSIGTWATMGDATEFAESKERREILSILHRGERLKPKAINEALGRDPKNSTVRVILRKMLDAGKIDVDAEGAYGIPINTVNT